MTSTDDVEANLQNILKSLKTFDGNKADLVCFPENSLYFNFQKNLDKSRALKRTDAVWAPLMEWAAGNDCYLHLGGVPFQDEGQVFNASILLTPAKELRIVYRKIHLFDVNVQGRELRESLSVDPGAQTSTVDIKGWKVGMTICYDLRFAEMFVQYHRQEVDLILVPSSFLVPTGRAHWATLLRARAIESQAFVAAPAQGGTHAPSEAGLQPKQTWGQSLLFGPWGEEMARAPSFDENIKDNSAIFAELDRALIQKSREQIPLLSHRKLRF